MVNSWQRKKVPREWRGEGEDRDLLGGLCEERLAKSGR